MPFSRTAAVVGALSTLAAAAHAQLPVPTPNPFKLGYRIGVFMPSTEEGRDIGNSWFAAGIDYPLIGAGVPMTDLGASASLSLDYYEKEGNRSIPAMANYVVRFREFSYTAGVGIGFNKLDGGSERATTQYQVGVGYRFSQMVGSLSIEARYWRAAQDELTGYAVYLGFKF